jgi:predicted secreted protein
VSQTFIPGWKAAVTIGTDDVTLIGSVLAYQDQATGVPKPTFGTPYRRTIKGQSTYNISLEGHLAAEEVATLWTAKATDGPVAWEIQIGTESAATDGGKLDGSAVITALEYGADAEGNWSWTMTLEGDGTPNYTPPAGP